MSAHAVRVRRWSLLQMTRSYAFMAGYSTTQMPWPLSPATYRRRGDSSCRPTEPAATTLAADEQFLRAFLPLARPSGMARRRGRAFRAPRGAVTGATSAAAGPPSRAWAIRAAGASRGEKDARDASLFRAFPTPPSDRGATRAQRPQQSSRASTNILSGKPVAVERRRNRADQGDMSPEGRRPGRPLAATMPGFSHRGCGCQSVCRSKPAVDTRAVYGE